MALMDKLFGGLKMSWPHVIVFALCAGAYTGLVASIDALEVTSFHDIAVSHEWWLIFAFIIASNCRKNWECTLKTFVFFLISQPLVYIVQVLLHTLDASFAIYCYVNIWGPATLFTLPGGFLAFYITKQNVFGSIVLGLGCTIQAIYAVYYGAQLLGNPPYHLLTVLIDIASIFVMTFAIQKQKKHRIIALGTVVVTFAVLGALLMATGRTII